MPQEIANKLDRLYTESGASGVLTGLIGQLRASGDYHGLFDALVLKKKYEFGIRSFHPSTLDDIPSEKRAEFEKAYVAAAHEVGDLFLSQRQLSDAWIYYRTIRETSKIASLLESWETPSDEVIDLALFQELAPAKGLELLLKSHGTCSTITAFDQKHLQLKPEARAKCSAILVRRLYSDLTEILMSEVNRKHVLLPQNLTLRELFAGREWLFEDGNYHLDVSHLHAVVRFSRSLEAGSDLEKSLQLAEYGERLAPQFQYASEPPFQEYYRGHQHYFRVILNQNREDSLNYFRKQLGENTQNPESQLVALSIVELLSRIGQESEAVDIALKYLTSTHEQYGFSFADLCVKANRLDALKQAAFAKQDWVAYAAAMINGT